MKVSDYILKALQKEYSINSSTNLDEFNYVENGYVDSLGMIQFIVELEDEFNISFSDEEISSSEFQIVGSLIKMVERKINQ
ncbi:phosphopantetheine-binding protein [Saccharibacillus sp. O23]|uniref:phosphopantetheine-binding protein n=1 Tax=Saccharibacillus sp. O23 TaxID=2009338 RepID=UPI0015C62999|nr:phosphopantetheine-binding protein [Saccharibacillus sp. O23]